MNGFQFQAQIGQVSSDLESIPGQQDVQDTQAFGVSYNAGKLSVMAATSTEKSTQAETANTAAAAGSLKNKTDIIGATYDFGVAKAFAMYTDRELTRAASLATAAALGPYAIDQKDTTVGVTVPVGAKVVLVGSYSMGKIKIDGGSVDLDAYQLQANYNLSKRTKAYIMYGESKIDSEAKLSGYVAGVQHSF
jgi:predicted porin